MNPDLEKALTEMALKLGTSVDALWAALLWQARIDGIFNLAVAGAIALGAVVGYKKIRQYQLKEDSDDEVAGMLFLIYGGCCLVLGLAGISCLYDGLVATLNPEYWAVKSLLK